jgi:vacuolar-type H+-ATPase subunit E/Vma4
MEVIKSDDSLREEILKDARTKAARIIKKAEREAAELVKSLEDQAKLFEDEHRTNVEKSIEETNRLLYASVDIEARKKITGIIGEMVTGIFESIRQDIISGSPISQDDLYRFLIEERARIIGGDSFSVEAGPSALGIISAADLKKMKPAGGSITSVDETGLKEGLLLKSSDGKTASYISLRQFIVELTEQERTTVYNILTENNPG